MMKRGHACPCNSDIITILTLVRSGSFLLPVTSSMTSTPKLYICDLLDDLPSRKYSGAQYTLHDKNTHINTLWPCKKTSAWNNNVWLVTYGEKRRDVVAACELLSSLDRPKSVILGTMRSSSSILAGLRSMWTISLSLWR